MFTQGQIYRRKNLHTKYGGNSQNGIVTLSKHPYIFIFSGKSGHQHGYVDGWTKEGIYQYTGQGQIGDMEFKSGNSALRDHTGNNKRVFLFNFVKKGFVQFETELQYINWENFRTHDRENKMRNAIRFFFRRVNKKGFKVYDLNETKKVVFKEPATSYVSDLDIPTESQRLITTRIGQGTYRSNILKRWKYRCAVTGFDDTRILIASHIVPWKDSTDQERIDPNNGILLSPTLDALFDRHLISFKDSGEIMISNEVSKDQLNKLGIQGNEKIKGLTEGNFRYLTKHRALLK